MTPVELSGCFSTIVLGVKAQATDAAMAMLAPHLADDGFVLSAQNGLNELAITRVVGEHHMIGCFVNYGADWLGPGEFLFGNRAAVVVGEVDGSIRERTRRMQQLLSVFEPGAVLTDNIWGYLWGTLAYGAMFKRSQFPAICRHGSVVSPESASSPGFASPPEGVRENLGAARHFLMSIPASWRRPAFAEKRVCVMKFLFLITEDHSSEFCFLFYSASPMTSNRAVSRSLSDLGRRKRSRRAAKPKPTPARTVFAGFAGP